MDCTNTVYIYDGKDTWTDTNGVEWNQEVKFDGYFFCIL